MTGRVLTVRALNLRDRILDLHDRARHEQPAKARVTRAKAGALSRELYDLNEQLRARDLPPVVR